MPRSAADNAYERAEAEALALPDLCDVNIYSWIADAGGGRLLDGEDHYANQKCRLDSDGSGIERNDAAGDRIVSDYVLKMARFNDVPETDLGATAEKYIEIILRTLNGASVERVFLLINYGEVSEMGLRQLYVREIQT